MEFILKCFFEHFDGLSRDNLHARYRRQALVEYFNTLIEGCRLGEECDVQEVIREAIIGIIRYHEESRKNNGNVCLMGKYHNILYIAVKLSFDWQLKDTETVVTLLDNIYSCEKTFERILVGALFGCKAPHFIAGWKSDFTDQEENVRAMVYYLDLATNAKLEYAYGTESKTIRYVDIPIESCSKMTCVLILAHLGSPEILLILLRYGALLDSQSDSGETIFDIVLSKLQGMDKYPYNIVACLQILLRCTPRIFLENYGNNSLAETVLDRYFDLLQHGILPLRRSGFEPVELKHLCRCSVRQTLWLNYELPNGIKSLLIPDEIKRYIDILED